MNLSNIQSFIGRLTIDYSLFEKLKENSDQLLNELNFTSIEKDYVKAIDLEGFNTFREIVNGTRAHRFKELFSSLNSYCGSNWDELFNQFHKKMVINTSKDDADIKTFVEYLKTTFPNSVISNLGIYESELYYFNNLKDNISQDFKDSEIILSPYCRIFVLDFDIEDLLNTASNKDYNIEKNINFIIAKKDKYSDEIDMYSVSEEYFNVLLKFESKKEYVLTRESLENEEIINELISNEILEERNKV